MNVWAVVVAGKVDSLWTTTNLATDRQQKLLEANGSQLPVYLQEFVINGSFEETE